MFRDIRRSDWALVALVLLFGLVFSGVAFDVVLRVGEIRGGRSVDTMSNAGFVFGSGLLLTFILSAYLLLNARQNQLLRVRERSLHQANGLLEDIMLHTPHGLAVASERGQIQRANPAFSQIFPQAAPTTVSLFQLLQLSEAQVQELTQAATPHPLNATLRLPSQGDRGDQTLEYSLQRLPLGDDEDGLIVAHVFDVTARKLLEARVHQADRLDEMGRLVTEIAHKLNTPLGAITNNVELLEMRIARGDTSGLQKQAQRILAAAEEGAAYVRKLKELPHLEEEQAPAEQTVLVVSVLEDVLEQIHGFLLGKQVLVQRNYNLNDERLVRCHDGILRKTLMALLVRAVLKVEALPERVMTLELPAVPNQVKIELHAPSGGAEPSATPDLELLANQEAIRQLGGELTEHHEASGTTLSLYLPLSP